MLIEGEFEKTKAFSRTRIFLKGNRLYQVIASEVGGAGDWAKSDAVTEYLDSFQIEE